MNIWVRRIQNANWVLIAIVVLSLALRLWGIGFGLPYTYVSDEPTIINIALHMLKTGDLNPHWWAWPPLLIYLNAIALLLYFAIGRILGWFTSLSDLPPPQTIIMGVGKLSVPDELLIARCVSALFSVALIVLVYRIAMRWTGNKSTALIASLFVAISPTITNNSRTVAPDIFALFFLLVTTLYALRIVDAPRWANYAGAGISAGLAIASKYNAGVIVVAIITAHLIAYGRNSWRRKEMYISLGLVAVTFLIVIPFAWLDVKNFFDGFLLNATAYASSGHVGQEGNSHSWYLTYLCSSENLHGVLGALGIAYQLWKRSKKSIVLASFPLCYFAIISQLVIRNDRTFMLIIPFLDVFAASLMIEAWNGIRNRLPWHSQVLKVSTAAIGLLIVIPPLNSVIETDHHLAQPDAREYARQWIETQLPPQTRIALEAYSPYVDPMQFMVAGSYSLEEKTPDWYVANGFEYLIFSRGMYGRYFQEPNQYAADVANYNRLFSQFPQVAYFNQNDYEIQIYRTNTILPTHRINARYGDYGELVELVGYDHADWKLGEPLNLKMTWRTISSTPEPFQVEFRLLNDTDREVAKVSSDLFQGKGWQAGMFDGTWTFQVPPDLAPGNYRVQVDVVWTQYDYRTPAQTWSGTKIDPVLIGPIELKAN